MKRPHRVLVVDDDPAVAEMVVSLLTGFGYSAQAATSGETAIHAAQEFQPHLVLLDLRMPGLDGETVARRLRELGNSVPLVAMSAVTDADHWMGDSHIDVVSVLVKPFDISEMLTIVKNVIRETHPAA
jgi:DNA-binding response OmpR family regulator